MVALAPNTSETSPWDVLDTFPKLHSRAREEKTTSCTEVPDSKSLDCIEIWQVVFESCDGLESFTRDPIGFDGSEWNLYEFLAGRALVYRDPDGRHGIASPLRCCNGKFIDTRTSCCDGKAPKEKRSCSACCDEWKKNNTIPTTASGIVVCCDGQHCACYLPEDPPTVGNSIIAACVLRHERDHFDSIDCADDCGKPAIRPRTRNGVDVPTEECDAYHAEYNCLNRGIQGCNGDPICESEVRVRIIIVLDRVRESDLNCSTWWW